MPGPQKRKNKVITTKDSSSTTLDGEEIKYSKSDSTISGKKDEQDDDQEVKQWSFVTVINILMGLAAMVAVGVAHSLYMYQLHENYLWFTNIKEVEREISFRTESGLYYSYFKQVVHSPSLIQGVQELTKDKLTEHPDTINILERMNVYQEIILAFIYRVFNVKMQPILFYVYSVFGLHGFLVSSLYLMTWLLSESWLAGLLTAAFYIFNRLDTTRVEYTVPLRECFSLPFLWMQAAAITIYFKPKIGGWLQYVSQTCVFMSTFFFCLCWQFNQFIMMLQAFSLFGVWVLGLVPGRKVRWVLACELVSLMAVCVLQFGNKMIPGSMAVSFILVSLLLISLLGDQCKSHSVFLNIVKVVGLSLLSLILMVVISSVIKTVLSVDSDEHIFKFLQNKFGVGNKKDFDSRMYLCLGIFGFITWDVFERLTQNFVLPFYVFSHTVFLACLAYSVIVKWRYGDGTQQSTAQKKKSEEKSTGASSTQYTNYFSERSDLAFHTVQAVFFGALAFTTLRMKYLWTPYVCVFAAVGLADKTIWTKLLAVFKINNKYMITVVKSSVVLLVLAVMVHKLLPPIQKDLENETEFWDPDTVDLMEWIVRKTPKGASFTGSMQLLAGVKLCTGRPITNHPHYEDKYLRQKTKELYQIYGRRSPEDVHKILKTYMSSYIILEDSICRAPSKDGCRLPDLVDIDSGVMPDEPIDIEGLSKSMVPRFCEQVRHQKPPYSKYFKTVFENKTFRVYKVL